MLKHKLALASIATAAALGLSACGSGDHDDGPSTTTPVAVGDTVALTASGRLMSFNRATPATQVGSIAVTGLASGETLLGIDYRPADGLLYGLGSNGNLYTVVPSTGVATLKVALRAMTGDDAPYTALVGTSFAVDFNPVADRLRVVGNTGQNLRINVDTGDTTTDGAINPSASSVTAAGYTNSFAGTTSTQLFVLDAAAGRLQLQDPPNNGTLNAGVALGVVADAANGFDVDARSNTGFAALRVGTETALYRIDLGATASAATRVDAIAGGETIRGLALAPTARPTVIALGADNRLLAFDLRTPGTITSATPVTGLGAGETLLGIDFRPRDGLLYGLATGGKL